MQNNLTKQGQGEVASQTESEQAQTKAALTEFWIAMVELYGNQFISQWGDDPGSPGQWLEILTELKQIPENWKELLRISHSDWPPNPLQFYALMVDHGSIHGLPSFNEAWETARMLWLGVPRQISYADCHDLFYHMNLKGWFDAYGFRHASSIKVEKEWMKKFRAAHRRASDHARMGLGFSKWQEQNFIADKSQEPLSRDESKIRLAQLKKDLEL